MRCTFKSRASPWALFMTLSLTSIHSNRIDSCSNIHTSMPPLPHPLCIDVAISSPARSLDWMPSRHYDKIILGAGLYGLHAAERCGRLDQSVLVLEYDNEPFLRATYVNQARIHQGCHYPRSFHTAMKSARYFQRFNEDYGFYINKSFKQGYSISSEMSWTNAKQFKGFSRPPRYPAKKRNLRDSSEPASSTQHISRKDTRTSPACCAIT